MDISRIGELATLAGVTVTPELRDFARLVAAEPRSVGKLTYDIEVVGADAIAGGFARLAEIAADTNDHRLQQLIKLIERVGLTNWFNDDFVVLSIGEARSTMSHIDCRGFGQAVLDRLNAKIKAAESAKR